MNGNVTFEVVETQVPIVGEAVGEERSPPRDRASPTAALVFSPPAEAHCLGESRPQSAQTKGDPSATRSHLALIRESMFAGPHLDARFSPSTNLSPTPAPKTHETFTQCRTTTSATRETSRLKRRASPQQVEHVVRSRIRVWDSVVACPEAEKPFRVGDQLGVEKGSHVSCPQQAEG